MNHYFALQSILTYGDSNQEQAGAMFGEPRLRHDLDTTTGLGNCTRMLTVLIHHFTHTCICTCMCMRLHTCIDMRKNDVDPNPACYRWFRAAAGRPTSLLISKDHELIIGASNA
jgi:hypothetical protein